MDKDGKQKSNLGKDKNLNTEKNPVTGIKTTEPQSNKDNSETDENESANIRNDKSKTATGGSRK